MVDKDSVEIQKVFEKRWYQSKKFLAFLLLVMLLSSFVILLLKWQFDFGWPAAAVLTSIIFTMGFVTLAFNGKQALLDQFTRGLALTGRKPEEIAKTIESMRKTRSLLKKTKKDDE